MATGMTVYVMSFRDEVSDVTIEELEMKNNTYVYANDSNGELVCLYKVNNHTERIPVTIDQIPQHVKDAFVSAEDERFYTHDGRTCENAIVGDSLSTLFCFALSIFVTAPSGAFILR